ncbi:bacterial regulatory s, gntR family protein [Mycobacterium xenopi 4042]|uniref:Bacterial regulatory s, gntR family protein n=1 Tax=Mycobacterium xenopi 4042 TaxID=1299334 RepID=X8DXR8_MYCXE|nr:bacterial regulatory s, gntR family protein [Mycobacterium xenopi 4042]
MPTVRELAGQLHLAVNTVARAYRELEGAGIVETRGRFGTFVARADPADAAMAAAAGRTSTRPAGWASAKTTRFVISMRRPPTEADLICPPSAAPWSACVGCG